MNIPSLPTDNLYKFCAISGLALMLFALTYPVQKVFDLQLKVADAETEVELYALRTEYLKTDSGRLIRRKDATLRESQQIEQKTREAELRNHEMRGENKKLGLLLKQSLVLLILSAVSSVAGLRLAYFGFTNWYNLVQKPADVMIARQAASLDT